MAPETPAMRIGRKKIMADKWTPSEMGRKGGRKSRRNLDPDTARQMVKIREIRKMLQKQPTEEEK